MILTEAKVISFIRRYDGYAQPPLTRDETEFLLFALYIESEARGGVVYKARLSMHRQGREPEITA